MQRTAPYGSWPSPVTAELAGAGTTAGQIAAPSYVGVLGGEVWWVEPRPAEGGRLALMRDGRPVLPAPWDVRSRVIEYGGRPWAAARGERGVLVVFTDVADQRLYAYEADVPGARPRPLTPLSAVGGGLRWAEPEIDAVRGEVRCVLEEFTGDGPGDVRRLLAAVPLDGRAAADRSAVRELGGDRHRFVSAPRFSPDGARAVWLAWDHPHMPWDAARLVVADVAPDGSLHGARTLAGGPGEPVAQAEWTADGALLAASERTGWWNLYRIDPDDGALTALHPAAEEFAGAQRLGLRWFVPLPGGRIGVLHGVGAQRLGVLDAATGELADVPGPWTEWLPHLAAEGDRVVGVAARPAGGYEVVEADTAAGPAAAARAVGHRHRDRVDPRLLPAGEARVFTGPDGREVHAHLHPPRHPDCAGPAGEAPPYVVWAHGGPGLRAPLALNLEIAYFTSRGIGVVDVNYGGTPGYGRAYRERLRGQWGVVDVEDCAAVARALVAEGLAAPGRVAIRGGSAGGFTAAASLVAAGAGDGAGTGTGGGAGDAAGDAAGGGAGEGAGAPSVRGYGYACATLLYPVLDLEALAAGGTHDFEAHYLDSLVGPPDEVPGRYRDRSPAAHPERIAVPFLLLQGAEDPVCPPAQAERFLAGATAPYTHRTFPGEGHGFRRTETTAACLEAELALYGRVFGFPAPDGQAPAGTP